MDLKSNYIVIEVRSRVTKMVNLSLPCHEKLRMVTIKKSRSGIKVKNKQNNTKLN